nr:MAG TPA: hypothetical protein [Caudoviricetes sp.]
MTTPIIRIIITTRTSESGVGNKKPTSRNWHFREVEGDYPCNNYNNNNSVSCQYKFRNSKLQEGGKFS